MDPESTPQRQPQKEVSTQKEVSALDDRATETLSKHLGFGKEMASDLHDSSFVDTEAPSQENLSSEQLSSTLSQDKGIHIDKELQSNLTEHGLQGVDGQDAKQAQKRLKAHAKYYQTQLEELQLLLGSQESEESVCPAESARPSGAFDQVSADNSSKPESFHLCDLNEAMANYYHNYWRHMGIPSVDIGGAWCVHTDVPLFAYKGVYKCDWARMQLKDVASSVARYFREKGGWFSWFISHKDETPHFKEQLYSLGLEKVKTWVGMEASSVDYPYVMRDPKFRCVHVSDAKQLGQFLAIHAEEYGYDRGTLKQIQHLHKVAGYGAGQLRFLAFYDGKPVGCGTYVRCVDHGCIYDLVIRRRFRRCGYGRCLLQELVAFAHVQKLEKVIALSPDASSDFFVASGFHSYERFYLYGPRC